MGMVVFYQVSTNKVLSYLDYDATNSWGIMEEPTTEFAASRNGLSLGDVGVKKFKKVNPVEADFKDMLTSLDPGDLEDF